MLIPSIRSFQLIDKELKSWILPNFTTTSHNDTVICAVFMMSTLKAYVAVVLSFE